MTDNISIQNRKAIGLNKGNEERMMMELKRRALEICDEDLFDFVKCTR